MERDLHPFEVEIATRFGIRGKWAASPKSEWIRGYLLTFGEGYPYEMWKRYCEFARYLGIRPGTYISFARHMWLLKRLGLIRPVKIKPRPGGFPKKVYRIVPGMEDSPLWRRPMQAMYPTTDWTRPERKRVYREKYR